MTRTFAWMTALLLGACRAQPEPNSAPQRTHETPREAIDRPVIEFVGCRHVEPGTCTLRAGLEGPLRVWIDLQAQAPLRVEFDGVPVEARPLAVDGGQLLRLKVPEQAKVLRIEAVDPPWTEPFELRFDREVVPAVVSEAETLVFQHQPEAAIEKLRAALPKLEGTDRLAALQVLRRLPIDPQAVLRHTEEAIELAQALGRKRDFAECAAAAAEKWTIERGDLVAARRWTQALELVSAELPEARVWARYHGGVLATRIGDLDSSVRALDEARHLAQRLDLSHDQLGADEQLATTLAELGRGDEALQVAREIHDRVREPDTLCSDRARALGNIAWINLLLAEAGLAHDSPRELLERQLDVMVECPNPSTVAIVNLAIVALAEFEPEEAWDWIGVQRAMGVPPHLLPWVDEIEAQIGVATGRESLIPALVRRPDPRGTELGLRWMAILRHAQTLDALGLSEAAIDSYLEAEALLEETVHSVGVDLGRELFLSGRRASAEGLVELLVRRGDVDEAFCRARLARGRSLRTIDRAARMASLSPEERARRNELLFGFLATQDTLASERRDDWKFSAPEREHRRRRRAERAAEAKKTLDEALRLIGGDDGPSRCEQLPALAPGVVAILQFPRPDGGSWIFVANDEGVSVRAAADPSDAAESNEWAQGLLEPFAERLAAARLIRVMPTGAGWSVAFHALRFAHGSLLDVAPVVYALDLPARAQPRENGRAVVVANPSKDLAFAEEEAGEVARRLAAAGWSVDRYTKAEASRSRLADILVDASLFHYAGHGLHGGVDGWGAALVLHDGDQLTASDILALPRVPDAVVLSGCDTATVNRGTIAGGMNLSRAFVLAGASWVVAADGEVDDDLARAVGEALYEGTVPTDGFDGPEALRRAQLRLREGHPDRWQAFRVIVP